MKYNNHPLINLLGITEDFLLFQPRMITDPDTGSQYEVEQYDASKNTELFEYISSVEKPFVNLFNCYEDLVFLETCLHSTNSPSFENPTAHVQYARLIFQHWIVKGATIWDCAMHAVNGVYELGLPSKEVRSVTVKDNLNIQKLATLRQTLMNFEKYLSSSMSEVFWKASKPFKKMRNDLIHSNDFAHPDIENLHSLFQFVEWGFHDMAPEDVQGSIGALVAKLQESTSKVNSSILQYVANLTTFLNDEYNRRFKLKLINC